MVNTAYASAMAKIQIGPELTNEAPVGTAIGPVPPRRTPVEVPTHRYISPEWAELEMAHVWPKAWQLACTADHVPQPGDWFEYSVGNLSVLVVRGDDDVLRGFQNVCRHRGNVLCTGSGSGLTELRCIYHRWSWTLDGKLREVPSRRGFGALRNDDYPLFPVQVGTWGPLVFVNLDMDAEPLDEYLEAIPGLLEWARMDEYACAYDLTVPLPCNWKTLIEAFSETYHVQGIHREMLPSCDDVNSVNRLYGRHGSLHQPYGVPSPRLRDGATDQEIWESIIVTQGARYGQDSENPGPCPPVPDGGGVRDVLEELVRVQTAQKGLDLDSFDQSQMLDLFQFNLFPNITVIVMCDSITVLRSRPGETPDDAYMDLLHLDRRSPGIERAQPMQAVIPAEEAAMNLVFDQDLSNLQRAQRGLHQPGLDHIVLSREEMRIINLHYNLEEFIGIRELSDEAVAEIEALRAQPAAIGPVVG